jgi:phosphate/sulfate permease
MTLVLGLTTGKANVDVMGAIVLSWLVTLLCAAIVAGGSYWVATSLHS